MDFDLQTFLKSVPTKDQLDAKSNEPDLETKLQMLLQGLDFNSTSLPESLPDEQSLSDEQSAPQLKQASLSYTDGSEYRGSINAKSKQRQGYGTLKRRIQAGFSKESCPDFVYTGEFHQDVFGNGSARLEIFDCFEADSIVLHYKGDFEHGLFDGFGTLRIPGQGEYNGQFKQGRREGTGRYETSEITYEGSWKDDKMHGPGVLGSQVENTLFNGMMAHGRKDHGTLKFLSRHQEYQGYFDADGKFTGYSKLKMANGNNYRGDFEAGVYHGDGVMRY